MTVIFTIFSEGNEKKLIINGEVFVVSSEEALFEKICEETAKIHNTKNEQEEKRIERSCQLLAKGIMAIDLQEGEEASFIIHEKEKTEGCREAAKHRMNLDRMTEGVVSMGVDAARELKSIVLVDKCGKIYYYLLPGDKELTHEEMKGKSFADLEVFGLIEYTVNPGSFLLAALDESNCPLAEVNVDEAVFSQYLSNNLGSPHLSLTCDSRIIKSGFEEIIKELKSKIPNLEVKELNDGRVVPKGSCSKLGIQALVDGDYLKQNTQKS